MSFFDIIARSMVEYSFPS